MKKIRKIWLLIPAFLIVIGAAFYLFDMESLFYPQPTRAEKTAIALREIKEMEDREQERIRSSRVESRAAQDSERKDDKQKIIAICHLQVKPADIVIERLILSHDDGEGNKFQIAPDDALFLYSVARVENKIRFADVPDDQQGDTTSDEQYCFGLNGNIEIYFKQYRNFDSQEDQSSGYNYQAEYNDEGKLIEGKTKIDYYGDFPKLSSPEEPRYNHASQLEKKMIKSQPSDQ